jgi:aminoglycoside/choline kinase family phosphotransferase
MPDALAVADRYLRTVAGTLQVAGVSTLTADASDRRYVRVRLVDGRSLVLAVHGGPIDFETLPFANVSRLLSEIGIPVPAILGHADDLGVVALDDLGDVTLQTALDTATPAERRSLYRDAVDLIVRIQRGGAQVAPGEYLPYRAAFDVPKLVWELRFFVQHFLEGHRRAVLPSAIAHALDEEWTTLAGTLAAEARVVCHRDYHARNLMYHEGRLHLIDFQDARMGPDTYDLVSLLRDCYVDLPQAERDALIEQFANAVGHGDLPRFMERFDMMSVQRHLKALGTFGFQAAARDNPSYLRYVPRTIGYLRDVFSRRPRFSRLAGMLEPWL